MQDPYNTLTIKIVFLLLSRDVYSLNVYNLETSVVKWGFAKNHTGEML